jgi:diacylglycerol O-acyltransferase / wax synthase
MIEHMNPLDAVFLYAEDGINHMHIGSCAVFAGPPPTISELTKLIESKLPQLSRYRQRIRFVPGGVGHPVWVDAARFDLADHIRHTSLPAHATEQDLDNLMGRVMSHELDRRRPLWEAWIVEGLPRHRWALISKVHHCMVDGVSGTDLMTALLDSDPEAPGGPIEPRANTSEPSDVALVADAVIHFGSSAARELRQFWSLGLDPRNTARRALGISAGMRSLAGALTKRVTRVSVEGDIGPQRRWACGRCSLADAKTIGHALGGSVNDVVLTAISGAFRALLIERGEPVDDDLVLRSLVPVSVRAAGDHTANNQVAPILAELPVGIADPMRRFQAIRDQMVALKASHQVEAAGALFSALTIVPAPLVALLTRGSLMTMRRLPATATNTVTTNVPGPQFPLYACGREMIEYLPYVPLTEGIRVGVAIMSYNGRIAFGITADYDTVPDVNAMAMYIEREIAALRSLAKHRRAAS